MADQHVVIAGGGVGGLAAALTMGRAGHRVTVVERDALPVVTDAEAAFALERRGAPQVHQTHGFLARIVVELREHLPDVLDALLDAGCTTLPMTANLGDLRPGDEDLRVLIVRRSTFEWVLRRAALADPSVEIRSGAAVRGVTASPSPDGLPVVDGITLDDGTTLPADVVVAATGRRGEVPGWLSSLGVEVPETVHESGLMYLSRWYRLPAGQALDLDPKLGGDLGYLKYLAVPGDGDTLSITLAVRPDDGRLRAALSEADGFEQACRLLPGPQQFFERGPLEALGGVRPMGGLINRLRRFVDADGAPLVTGFHAVGDAHTCTNPLYGRGCSLAVVQAVRLARAAVEHRGDPVARASAYEAACVREVEPWFDLAVQMDRMGADPALAGAGAAESDQGKAMAAVFAAAATDPVIGRGMARLWNLLATPADLMADGEFLARSAAVMAEPEKYPPPDRTGPTRGELLAALDVAPAPDTDHDPGGPRTVTDSPQPTDALAGEVTA